MRVYGERSAVASFPRTIIPFEVSSLEMPGPLISKAQSGRVNIRSTQQIGRTWTEHYLINVRSVAGRGLLAAVDNFYRNGTIFTIDHRDHLTPMGTGGGSPLVNAAPQLVTDPENINAWTATTTTRTSGQSDWLGGTAAYLLTPTGGVTSLVSEVVSFTGDGTKCILGYMRAGTSTRSRFGVFDSTAAANRHSTFVTWTAGVPSLSNHSGSGVNYTPELISGGWYALSATADSVVAANVNNYRIFPDDLLGTGTVYFFGANAWNELSAARYAGPSQPAATTGSSLALNGGTASVSNWLRSGDILSISGLAAIYEVTADVSTQVNGYVVVPVNPPIFSGGGPADNAAVTITGVTMNACILEPPSYPSTSGIGADYGELICKFSESL